MEQTLIEPQPKVIYIMSNFYKESVKRAVYKYRQNHPDRVKAYRQKYLEENKERIKDYYNEEIVCSHCGATVKRKSLYAHRQTLRHLKSIDNSIVLNE